MHIQQRNVTCPTCGQAASLTMVSYGPGDREIGFACPSDDRPDDEALDRLADRLTG